jgi:WD repeat-containing protein 61
VSGAADGHMRIFDASQPSLAVHDIPTNPLAISSLSVSADGRYALGASLDGTVALVNVSEGKIEGMMDTAREKVGGETRTWI